MSDKNNDKNMISIIIPVYNTEKYIKECLNSLINQTYRNIEIIIINDGSTDNSLNIINNFTKKYNFIKCTTIKNSGQGYARNFALKKAKGDFIMFMDSDDYIEPITLELALNRILEDESDFVYYDFKYLKDSNKTFTYDGCIPFFSKKVLIGNECKELLDLKAYFTVNKLYRKKYLVENDIQYGEKYIYEDIKFWIKCVINAKKVSILHSPLYIVRINDTSTTKANYNTTKHMEGFIKSFDDSIEYFDNKKEYLQIFLNYMIRKFYFYYNRRTPKKIKKQFAYEFYDRISKYNFDDIKIKYKYFNYSKKIGFLKTKYRFYISTIFYKFYLFIIKIKKKLAKLLTLTKKIFSKDFYNYYYMKTCKKLDKQILFMGFDYRYTGNSRYLYEGMKNSKCKMYFVCKDDSVIGENIIKPNTKKFYKLLYSSKIVIFESWIPNKFEKPKESVWINLWHGTPLKKMLYDSNEEEIMLENSLHKRNKFKSIEKMNYLLTDNKNINKYFNTSFLLDDTKLLSYGYPRVKYLIDNKNNIKLKKQIRKKLNVDDDKILILYFPTWRDYNYSKNKKPDFNYLLDVDKLSNNLGDKYQIISKDHVYLKKDNNVPIINIETQELILVSDYIITDYSSVMFDAFAIDIPVCIIAKDFQKYMSSRGLYLDMWKNLDSFVVDNEKDLSNLIKNYKIDKNYIKIKKLYSYKSDDNLEKFIKTFLKK